MKLLQHKPDTMNQIEWAFALRWSAQEMLAGSAKRDETLALSCLLKSYELGDAQAGWEIATCAIERGICSEIINQLICFSALHGSIDAAWWMRDQSPTTSEIDWNEQVEKNFRDHETMRLTPPLAADVAALKTCLALSISLSSPSNTETGSDK